MQTKLLFIHALSPIHAGTGQSIGAIDLAIARDRTTDHPYIPGSSIKGTLRSISEGKDELTGKTAKIFGPEAATASDHAGALAVGDAQLLLLPVRSVAGTFAWVTSPFILAKFLRDVREAGVKIPKNLKVPEIQRQEECLICGSTSKLVLTIAGVEKVIFEDLDLDKQSSSVTAWADFIGHFIFDETWRELLKQRFCVVHDDVMTFFAKYSTDVVTRVVIETKTKTAKDGGLWTEENLPSETVLVSALMAMPNKYTLNTQEIFKALEVLTKDAVQLGGHASIGRGRCRLVIGGK